jgi:hypothetical protein
MIKKKVARRGKHVIDLTGPKGNAWYLLGAAESYCKQLGLDFESIEEDMKSSDYEHLILVFDKHFGNYVDLER